MNIPSKLKIKDGPRGGEADAASLVCRRPEPVRTDRLLNEIDERSVVPLP